MNTSSFRKWLLVAAGILSVGLGVLGIFLPILPTTPFLLLAAACFIRSSDRLYDWLIHHKWFGPYIRNYREHKAITKRTKIGTLLLLWGTIGYTAFGVLSSWTLRALLLLVAIGVTIHVLSMKTLTKEMVSGSSDAEEGLAYTHHEDGFGQDLSEDQIKESIVSKCRVRLILWLLLAVTSVGGGILIDLTLGTKPFPWWIRLVGLLGIVLMHFPLKRTGRLLSRLGDTQDEWGCTTRLVTTDIYRCVRHPHHVAIGFFMTSLGLFIGHVWSFLIISLSQWAWIFGFLFLVEEKELIEKFGEEYKAYRRQVPMLIPKLRCAIRILSQPIDIPE